MLHLSIFNILCEEMGIMQEVLLHTKAGRLSPGKVLRRMSCCSHFFIEYHLYLKEQLIDELWLLRCGYVEDILSWKWMEWPCHLKENNWQNLLPMTKSKLLSNNCNSGKCSAALWPWQFLNTWRLFFERIGGDSNECNLLMLYNEVCHGVMIPRMGKKIHSKYKIDKWIFK